MNNTTTKTKQTIDVRKLVFTALLSAMAVVLMKFLAFKIPIMPGFISFDFSDVPAVLASLTMGPVSGVAVCLIKNLGGFLLAGSMTGGVGEVSNFILGCLLVIPAGLIANRTGHSMKHVVLAALRALYLWRWSALRPTISSYIRCTPQLCRWKPSSECIRRYGRALIRSSSVWWYSICRSLL